MTSINYALVGWANAGKSTLFNQLTSGKQNTGNWAGVTVASKKTTVTLQDQSSTFIDIPGISSLSQRKSQSSDLTISHEFLKEENIHCLVNVVDVTQLRRQLYLTTQLLELGLPMVVVLTRADKVPDDYIDTDVLSNLLGCPVVLLDSRTKAVSSQLTNVLAMLPEPTSLPISLTVPEAINSVLRDKNETLLSIEQQAADDCACDKSTLTQLAMKARYEFINEASKQSINSQLSLQPKRAISERIDQVILHPIMGIPVFLMMMYLLFMFAINVGSAFIDFFDILAGTLFVEYPMQWLSSVTVFGSSLPIWFLTIIEGAGSGIQTVATFIPVIVCLFIGLSLLETSGYLARAAFVVESVMQKIGLPGKAFVPLIVGFGCTVPAVMSARVLDSERERIVTIMMSPFMSCGARLPVYALFAAAFFPDSGQNLVFLLYLVGIIAAIGTGYLLKKTVLPGNSSMTIMELPQYEMPQLFLLCRRVLQRTRSFVKGAGKTIVVVVCILNFFNSLGTNGEFGHQDSAGSILSQGAQIITPVLTPMGIKEDNWQAGVGIITGIFAKEALVATFNSLYSSTHDEPEGELSLSMRWNEATDSIKQNLLGIAPEDPLGADVGDVSDLTIAAQEQGVEVNTYHAMTSAFAGQLGAFSYLLFILLYTPCAAAMGAIKNEVGNKWAGFAGAWSFVLAYLSAVLCFQVGSIHITPFTSSLYIVGVLLSFAAIYLWLKHRGKQILTIPTVVSYS